MEEFINKEEEEGRLNDVVFFELEKAAKETRKNPVSVISRVPIQEVFLFKKESCSDVVQKAIEYGLCVIDKRVGGLRKDDFKGVNVVIDKRGKIYNDFTLLQRKVLHALQRIASQEEKRINKIIEDYTESKKRHEKKLEAIRRDLEKIEKETGENFEKSILNTNEVAPVDSPHLNGFEFSDLSDDAKVIFNDIIEKSVGGGVVIATPQMIFEALGRTYENVNSENIKSLQDTLEGLGNSKYIRFLKRTHIEAVKENILNLKTLYAIKGYKRRLYVINMSSVFSEEFATGFCVLPDNDAEIMANIHDNSFMNLYDWILNELSENRRNATGKKTNKITKITDRKPTMKIHQTLKDDNSIKLKGFETAENKIGLFSVIYDDETLRHKSFTDLFYRLANMLHKLSELGFVQNISFSKDRKSVSFEVIKRQTI